MGLNCVFFCLGRSRPKQKQLYGAHALTQLDQKRPPNSAAAGMGPMAAMQAMDAKMASASERLAWLEESRMDAILGACSRSYKSVRSGIRCWTTFVGESCSLSVARARPALCGQIDMIQYQSATSHHR